MSPCKCDKMMLQDYVDGVLDRSQKMGIEAHLLECEICSDFVEEMQNLKSTLKNLPEIQASDGFHLLLRERIRREMAHQTRRSSFSWTLTHQIIPATALAAVIVVASLAIFKHGLPFTEGQRATPVAVKQPNSTSPQLDPARYKNVRYVLDDYGPAVSLDRKDTPATGQSSARDSLRRVEHRSRLRPRAAHVSF